WGAGARTGPLPAQPAVGLARPGGRLRHPTRARLPCRGRRADPRAARHPGRTRAAELTTDRPEGPRVIRSVLAWTTGGARRDAARPTSPNFLVRDVSMSMRCRD